MTRGHAVRHKNWKLYLPHTYRTLNGRVGTNDGLPITYEQFEIKTPTLFNLTNDPEENLNVAEQYPEMVDKIAKIADSIRYVLGDQLKGIKGNEVRPVGKISQ